MQENSKKLQGDLTIYKEYLDGKKEVAYHTNNIATIGFSQLLTNILSNNIMNSNSETVRLGSFQLGTGGHSTYADNTFYSLDTPLILEQYGRFTDLNIQKQNQVTVLKDFVESEDLQYSTSKQSFIKLSSDSTTVLNGDKLLIRLTLDEYTANNLDISECGLFTDNIIGGDISNPTLVAYKAFGITDGAGTAISIAKTSDFKLIIEWNITLKEGDYVIPLPYSTSSNTVLNLEADIYLPTSSNDGGNSWVCYFPDPIVGKDPPTASSIIANPIRKNVQKDFVIRLLNKGVGVISCDYHYPSSTGEYPLMTSSTASNHPIIASSVQPLALSGGIQNAYTEAAQMAQFAKYICSSVNFNASNVVYAGESFGGTLAAWLAYAPEFSGTTGGTYYETCSTRGLGVASKDASLNWNRFWPFRLGAASAIYDFRPFALPKALVMSGTVYSAAAQSASSVLQSASNDYFQGTWATSAIANDATFISTSAALGYKTSSIDASGNLFVSAIPGLKNSYQFMEIPTLAKEWYSPVYHASGTSSTSVVAPWGASVTVGHPDNATTYFHVDYSGSSLSGASGPAYVSQKTWRVLSATDLVLAADQAEPASGIDITLFSGVGGIRWDSSSYGNTNAFARVMNFSSTNSFEDPFFGMDLWSNMSGVGTHATSSTFRYVDPAQARNNASNFNYPNKNQAALSAKARAEWILNLFSIYDSWYIPFL